MKYINALVTIAVVILIFSFVASQNTSEEINTASTASAESEADITAEPAPTVTEAPEYISVLEEEAAALTVDWEGAELTSELNEELRAAIRQLTAEGYDAAFMLYDINTGCGISYHPTESYYCASTIKGPYVVCLADTVSNALYESGSAISETIAASSNEDYSYLWDTYGTDEFSVWIEEAGCENIDLSTKYPAVTARELTAMWIKAYEYFCEDTNDAHWLSDLYIDSPNSCIFETLGDSYVVYSKAGWICEDEYYNVQNDAGIIMKGENPYVLTILSNAYERLDLLDELVQAADDAHSYLISSSTEIPAISAEASDTGEASDSETSTAFAETTDVGASAASAGSFSQA